MTNSQLYNGDLQAGDAALKAKLAMMVGVFQEVRMRVDQIYHKPLNKKEGYTEHQLGMNGYHKMAIAGMIDQALTATAEDVERWKAEQQEIVRLSVTESLARKLEVLADKCEAGDAVRRENNLIYAAWIRSNA